MKLIYQTDNLQFSQVIPTHLKITSNGLQWLMVAYPMDLLPDT